jgi:hypothetical protein
MKLFRSITAALLLTIAWAGASRADTLPTLNVLPEDVVGPAGSTVGWGFTLTNLGADFAVITGSDFCVGVPTSPCSNPLGTYTDFIGAQFVVIGPSPESSTLAQSFNDNLQTGLGSFLINPGGSGTLAGELLVSYDLFSVDPNALNFDPTIDTLSVGNFLTSAASVTVGTVTVPTPEPATLSLLLGGLVGSLLLAKPKR